MESDRKLRAVTNFYRKNTLKKYFFIWKKYARRKLCFINKSMKIQRHGYFNSNVRPKNDNI